LAVNESESSTAGQLTQAKRLALRPVDPVEILIRMGATGSARVSASSDSTYKPDTPVYEKWTSCGK
jgi:hypothetical protein